MILVLVITTACGTQSSGDGGNSEDFDQPQPDEHRTFTGYIAKLEDDRMLVTENKIEEEEANHEDLDDFGEKAGSAVYFSMDELDGSLIETLSVGDFIEVDHEAIAESYPGQSSALDVRHLDDD